MTKPRHRLAPIALALATAGAAQPAWAAGGELVLVPDPPMLVALVVFFVALVYPMNKLLFGPIFATLDAREARISGTRARAEHLAREADDALARYENSVRAAREEAEAARKASLGEARDAAQEQGQAARADAEGELDRAASEIAAELASARTALRGDAQALAREAAASVLGRGLS